MRARHLPSFLVVVLIFACGFNIGCDGGDGGHTHLGVAPVGDGGTKGVCQANINPDLITCQYGAVQLGSYIASMVEGAAGAVDPGALVNFVGLRDEAANTAERDGSFWRHFVTYDDETIFVTAKVYDCDLAVIRVVCKK